MTEDPAQQGLLQADYEQYLRRKRIADGERLVRADPDDANLRISLALLLARQNQHERAAGHLAHAVQLEPTLALARNRLGLSLQKLGRLEEAIEQYRAVLTHDPQNVDAHDHLGNALFRSGQVQAAEYHRHQSAALTVRLAEQALKNLDQFMEQWSDEPVRLYNMANSLYTVGRYAEAISLYKKAIEVQQSGWRIMAGVPHFMLHHNLAASLIATGQVQEAIGHYRKTIELQPDHAQSHVSLANALSQVGQIDTALDHYQRAVDLAPTLVPARFNFAMALQSRQRFDEAVEQLRALVKAYPQLGLAHFHLGAALDRMGRSDQAVASYREALRLALEANDPALAQTVQARLHAMQR
jgi:tetratricopeptide (TPR) repeat protein